MREFSVPATVTVADEDNVSDMVFATAERFSDAIVYRRRVEGTWVDVTAQNFAAQVLAVAKGLRSSGIAAGDRVAVLSRTRYEWTLLDFAILAAGAVTVPIYETSSAEQIEWIMSDSGAKAIIVEAEQHAATVQGVKDKLVDLVNVWQIDGPEPAVEQLTALGADVSDEDLHAQRRAQGGDDLASLVYTSGTTGRSKGCELTHRNIVAEVRTVVAGAPELLNANTQILLFLPLAHILARVVQFAGFQARATVGHTADVKNLLPDLAEFRPTLVLSVPRVFEKVYNSARQKAHSAGKGKIFDAAEATAVQWSEAQDKGGAGLGLKVKHALFDRLVYGKLRAALGGRCTDAVSGGAPLGVRLGHFFRGIGVTVYEGYGLTETSAAATIGLPKHFKVGTVGRPIGGTSIRIAEDGEIMIKGDVVFRGYWNNPSATAEALTEDRWFHSGDIGELDSDGYLRITGRKKELIVTAAGKNVAPAVLEDRLRAHALISQCMVVGDNQPFIGALVTIDPEAFPLWRDEHGKTGEVADLAEDPDLRAEIDAAVAEANKAVSAAEAIKKFRILPVDFTEAGGQLTPTLKLKRNVVAKEFAHEIDAIYTR
ncbi:MAG TPA: long-chain fatty acid--CoA ligase [Pseudonocardiaceae bacterium]